MGKIVAPIITVLFVLAIVLFTTTYTVRFTESAVLTTMGRAGEGAVKTEPGLKFKWPYPFQSVTKYDNRLRLLQTRSTQIQLADDSQIIVEAFATWRVADPLKFFQRFSNAGERTAEHARAAEDILDSALSSTLGEVSRYSLNDLFTAEDDGTKLPEVEDRMLAVLRTNREAGQSLSDYGIEVTTVGINRILLPEETTGRVIERMGAVRDSLAQELSSRGSARAAAIRAQAEADAEKIRVFAQRRAQEIRALGEEEAAQFYAAQAQNEELAVFLQKIDLMKNAMAKKFTLILSTSDYGLELFTPDALSGLQPGQIPGSASLDLTGDRAAAIREIRRLSQEPGE